MSEDKQEIISEQLIDEFKYFQQDHSHERMGRNLREIFFDYMRQQIAGPDVEFDVILDHMEALMAFLDRCSDETKDLKNKLQNASI